MSKSNEITIATYDNDVQAYIDGTPQQTAGFQKQCIDVLLNTLPKDAAILEIGSAFGRDAKYLIERGYSPELTDATPGFVQYLTEHGFDARLLDIVQQQPEKKYDLILACAVFLHFTDDDFSRAVGHVRDSLQPAGRFAFSLKYGEGEEWSSDKMGAPRYFRYWNETTLENKMGNLGMRLLDVDVSDDGKWLHAVAVS